MPHIYNAHEHTNKLMQTPVDMDKTERTTGHKVCSYQPSISQEDILGERRLVFPPPPPPPPPHTHTLSLSLSLSQQTVPCLCLRSVLFVSSPLTSCPCVWVWGRGPLLSGRRSSSSHHTLPPPPPLGWTTTSRN